MAKNDKSEARNEEATPKRNYNEDRRRPNKAQTIIHKPNLNASQFSKQQNIKDLISLNYPWIYSPKALRIMSFLYPLKFKLDYPRNSSLNSNEQKHYIELHMKFSKSSTLLQSNTKEYRQYNVKLYPFTKSRLFMFLFEVFPKYTQ